ncbi:MAG: co-chaperone GroES [Candidatus Azosocius agrarius]|nr:MAG: co-chaperone GroES [Gammaproteobacteria bacterium]
MNIRPLYDRVVVERMDERITSGGIVIPDTVGDKPQRGIVRAVGKGKLENGILIKLEVKIGDEVLFGKYSGTDVQISGKQFLVMREDDIMGIIDTV